jgi:hypothetical protein
MGGAISCAVLLSAETAEKAINEMYGRVFLNIVLALIYRFPQ